MNKNIRLLFVFCALVFSNILQAQSLNETLSKLSNSVSKAYVEPIVSAFGSNLNSGWVSQLPSSTLLGFHLDLKIIGMGSFFSSDAKTFSASGQFYFNPDQTDQILQNSNITPATVGQSNYNNLKQQITSTPFDVNFNGPTIIGSKNEYLKINFPGKTIQSGQNQYTVNPYTISLSQVYGYLNELPAFPTGAIQLTVGTVYGTNVALRYFPDVNIQDMGKLSFWGVGLIHNPGVWFSNPLPVDLSVGIFIQKLTVGSIFESSTSQFGIYASKTFGSVISFSPYAGLTTETSKTTVSYTYQSNQTVNGTPVPPVNIAFDIDGNNTGAFLLGFNLHLAAVNINADYKIAKTNTVSAGLSFGF